MLSARRWKSKCVAEMLSAVDDDDDDDDDDDPRDDDDGARDDDDDDDEDDDFASLSFSRLREWHELSVSAMSARMSTDSLASKQCAYDAHRRRPCCCCCCCC